MFEPTPSRKYSIEEAHQIQQNHELALMFPRTDSFCQEDTMQILKLKYQKTEHYGELINYLYRCHKPALVQLYRKFIQNTQHIELPPQPNISTFYSNDCFINLERIGKYLENIALKNETIAMNQENGLTQIQKDAQTFAKHKVGEFTKETKERLDQLFQKHGYIPNLEKFLLFYPTFFAKFLALEKHLFEESRIDNKICYFLGLMACAQLGSSYGIFRMLSRFRKVGGNMDWFSKDKFPIKIKVLQKLNRKLARCNWEIDQDVIQDILQTSLWINNELAVIIEILTFSHLIATLSLSIGLIPEMSQQQHESQNIIDFKTMSLIKQEYDQQFYQSNQSQKLETVLQTISKQASDDEGQDTEKSVQKPRPIKQQLLKKISSEKESPSNGCRRSFKKQQRKSENDQLIQNYMKEIGNELTSQTLYQKIHIILQPLLISPYDPVEKRSDKEYPPRDSSDLNFKYTAFPLLYNLTNKAAQHVLDVLSYSEIMSSNNFGSSQVKNTNSFRKALRYYSENLCGHLHHEYDYKNISKLVTMPLKFYVRLLTLSPIHINKQVLKQIRHEQGPINLFDLGHVAILISCCKMGLSLTQTIHSFDL